MTHGPREGVEHARSMGVGAAHFCATTEAKAYAAAIVFRDEIAEADARDAERRNQAARRAELIERAGQAWDRRAGALKPDENGSNKAVIEVLRFDSRAAGTGRVGGTLIGKFGQFVLAQVQEQDAEKFSVQETFGQPHLFASGRFIRKYTFAGVARAAAVNHSSIRPALETPQAVQLRYFYDKHLRASLQAERGHYTRVIVDGDAYEGWVTTFNLTRDSQNEHWVNFVFSLVAFDRYHVHLEGSAQALFLDWDTTARVEELGYRQPQAELADAVGEVNFGVSLTAEGALSPRVDLGRVEVPPEEADRPTGLTFWLGATDPAGGPSPTEHVVSVTTDTPGVDVTSNGVPLHGQKSPSGGSRLVCSIKITDYSRFVRSAIPVGPASRAQSLVDKGVEEGTGVPIVLTIHPMAGQSATVRATVVPTGKNTLTVKLVSASMDRVGAVPQALSAGRVLTPVVNNTAPMVLGNPAGWSAPGKPGVWLPGNTLAIRLELEVKEGASFASEPTLNSLMMSDYENTAAAESLLPLVGAASRTLSGDDADKIKMQSVNVTKLPPDPATGRVTFVLTVTAAPGAPDLSLPTNPTFASSVIQFRYQPLLKADGLRDTRLAELVVDIGLPNPPPVGRQLWTTTRWDVVSRITGLRRIVIDALAPEDIMTLHGPERWPAVFDAIKNSGVFLGLVEVELFTRPDTSTGLSDLESSPPTALQIPLKSVSSSWSPAVLLFGGTASIQFRLVRFETAGNAMRLELEYRSFLDSRAGAMAIFYLREGRFSWSPPILGYVGPPPARVAGDQDRANLGANRNADQKQR